MADAAPARQDSALEYGVDPSRPNMKNEAIRTNRMGAVSDVGGRLFRSREVVDRM